MKKKIEIICTLGPVSINKKILKQMNKKVSLIRLNLSHIDINHLEKKINMIRKYSSVPICIDTEGAQIRTKVKNKKILTRGKFGILDNKEAKHFSLYPENVFQQLKKNDLLDIGFDGLKIKILKKKNNKIKFKVIEKGLLENNKGVHLVNRKINLNFLTKKDYIAINIAKKLKVNNFALSFTNNPNDIRKFNELIPKKRKIFKIETKSALKHIDGLFRIGQYFLIDRGDLSKEVSIENIPIVQRYIFNKSKKFKNIKIYIATNYLESMLSKSNPTRGEANDIFSSLEMGAAGIVLAAETAIGRFPIESLDFLNKMISSYKKKKIYKI